MLVIKRSASYLSIIYLFFTCYCNFVCPGKNEHVLLFSNHDIALNFTPLKEINLTSSLIRFWWINAIFLISVYLDATKDNGNRQLTLPFQRRMIWWGRGKELPCCNWYLGSFFAIKFTEHIFWNVLQQVIQCFDIRMLKELNTARL